MVNVLVLEAKRVWEASHVSEVLGEERESGVGCAR